MISSNRKIVVLTAILCIKVTTPAPISVPVDNNYSVNPSYFSQQEYEAGILARRPNSYFNRLPPYANQVQSDDIQAGASDNDYDYDSHQTDKPVINSSNQQYSNYNLLNSNYLLTEQRRKKKKRIRRPCVPIQSFGSPLFSNRLKRQTNNNPENTKSFGLLYGALNNYLDYGLALPGQYAPQFDNVNPQYDTTNAGLIQYQPYGGYPCVPISHGHRPGLFSSGGLLGGGLFGQGGLLDYSPPVPLAPAGIYQGSGNYPQTVVINRPPLFNHNNYGGSSGNRPQDFVGGGSNQPGFWSTVLNKLQESVRKHSLLKHTD